MLILVLLSNKFQFDFESDNVRCLVCQAVADEFLIAINRVDPKKKTEGMSSFRLDANGNQKKNVVGYHIQYLIHKQCKHRYNTEGDSIVYVEYVQVQVCGLISAPYFRVGYFCTVSRTSHGAHGRLVRGVRRLRSGMDLPDWKFDCELLV